ncbi:MAG: LPS export ABC transporter permease LptG [Usitatibacter sp.]
MSGTLPAPAGAVKWRVLFRYISREILSTSVLMLVALLVLFGFFDLIRELDDLGKGSYRLTAMLAFVTLMLPTHTYVLLPAAGLMGTLFALARMSEQSELTVMRASGLSLQQLALHVCGAGLAIAVATVVVGELVAPYTEEAAKSVRLKSTRSIVAREFRSGFWVKDDKSFVNIQDVTPDTELLNLRIYEFDREYRLISISRAEKGTYAGPNTWQLSNVELTRFKGDVAQLEKLPQARWTSVLTPDILSVLKIVPERMSAMNLLSYIEHLRDNRQKSTRYEIAFWNKLLYPIAAIMMMVMVIPFALGTARSGGIGLKIVFGILIGLGFHFAGRLFSHIGTLNDWPAIFSAGMPVVIVAVVAWFGLRRSEVR